MAKKQMDELLTCPICLDRFKRPKQLPCQHTFCLTPCLERLVERGNRVRCPECRALHRLPPNGAQGFPNNLIATKLLDVPAQNDFNVEAPCQDCKKNNVEAGCHHCDKILCGVCLKIHSQFLSRELKQTLSGVRVVVQKVSQRISEVRRHEAKVLGNTENVKANIREWRQRCISEIDNQANLFLNEVDAFATEELRPFKPGKDELTAVSSVLTNFCSNAEKEIRELSKSGKPASLIRNQQKKVLTLTKQGKDHATAEKRINFAKKCQVERNVTFCENDSHGIVKAITSFSGVQIESVKSTQGSTAVVRKPSGAASYRLALRDRHLLYKGKIQVKRVFSKGGSGTGCLMEPWGVALTREENIVVADTGNHRIQVFDGFGRSRKCFGSQGSGPGQFICPSGVCVTASGQIVVADHNNHRIQMFSEKGGFIREFGKHGAGKLSHPWSVTINRDGLLIIGDNTRTAKVYTSNGAFVRCISLGDIFGKELEASQVHVAASRDNKVAILCSYFGDIGMYNIASGNLIWKKYIGFTFSQGMVRDMHGNVFVSDPHESKIQILDKDGDVVTCLNIKGTQPCQMDSPRGMTVQANGDIVVSDSENNRIQIF